MQEEGKVDILLVDDQTSNLLALEAILEGDDRNLVRAASGFDALRKVLDHDFAVILLDVQMPGMDGFETAALIRERDRSKQTPIIFLTAFESSDVQVFKGYSLGAVDYLSKPIVPEVLRSKVAVFVDLFRKTEQVRQQSILLVENQRRELERSLAEEKRRWEVERLREETAREKQVADALRRRTEELAETIRERARAEGQLRRRALQQVIVARLGQRALEGADLPLLQNEAVEAVAANLEEALVRVMELDQEAGTIRMTAGEGWQPGSWESVSADVASHTFSGVGMLSSEPLVVENLLEDTRFALTPPLAAHQVHSGASIHVRGRDRLFGSLEVFSRDLRRFSSDDLYFLQSVANVLAAAIQRKRDEDELSRIKDELAVQLTDMTRLHSLTVRLSNSLELPTVLEQVLEAVTSLQGTDRGVLTLYDRDLDTMTTAASVGFTTEQLNVAEQMASSIQERRTVTAIISGGIIVEDLESDPIFAPHLTAALHAGCRAVCSMPLLTAGGELVGTIATYFDRPHRPSDRETRLVELYGRQAAQYIENARLYRQIREADRRKDEFLAMLAHELRNPLAPILNALHFLSSEPDDRAAVDQSRAIAQRQVRHLARLVDDLLDVSRISSGKIQLRKEVIRLSDALERAVQTSRPLIEARRHELTVTQPSEPVALVADSARLEQVLANLLNNAAKYTEEGGRIALTATQVGPEVEVKVTDTGIGIAPELLPRVFDLFTQDARSLDRAQGGLGIGLTLVQKLVQMHGGQVSVASEGLGQGSEFTIRIPVGEVPQPDRAGGEATEDPLVGREADANRKHLLLVDDNVDGTTMLARLLRSWGHQVTVAYDGPSAIEMVRQHPPDIVLLDIGLPGMNGYQVARELRGRPGLDRLRIVALSGYGQGDDLRRSRDVGIDQHLVKPVDPDALRHLLQEPPSGAPECTGGPLKSSGPRMALCEPPCLDSGA